MPILALLLLPVLTAAPAPERPAAQLRYLVEVLNNARQVDVVSSGAAGTQAAFRAVFDRGDWARFNWPRFEPIAGARQLAFWARRDGSAPPTLTVRCLRQDGSEWQAEPLPLSPDWSHHELAADAFRPFRGVEAATAGALDLGEVVQVQFVPASAGTGEAAFLVDEIELLPDGPRYTAEAQDQEPARDAAGLERERLADLLGRWRLETETLAADAAFAKRWLADLEDLRTRWTTADGQTQARERLRRGDWPWQQQPGWCGARNAGKPMPGNALDTTRYDALHGQFANRPVPVLADFETPLAISANRLYDAPEPQPPTVVAEGAGHVLRQAVVFSDAKVRQTVFTEIKLAAPVAVTGRVLTVRLRCTPARLNAEFPLLLRVWTRAPGGGESWADLRPNPMPGPDWTEVRFDATNPVRSAHYAPEAAERLSVRLENDPGTAARFEVGLDDVGLDWPAPAAQVRDALLVEALDGVRAAQLEAYAWRDRVARAEAALAATPDLYEAYLCSFVRAAAPEPAADAAPAAPLIDRKRLPAKPLAEGRIETATRLAETGPELVVRTSPWPGHALRLTAELTDPAGTLVAAVHTTVAADTAATLSLRTPRARLWQPAGPALYRLCAILEDESGRLLASTDREVGLRTVGLNLSGPTPALRHRLQPGQPDVALLWNGQPWFANGACYHWADEATTLTAGVRLCGDLWVEAFRDYGSSVTGPRLDRADHLGLARYASLAPGYKRLSAWSDVARWLRPYAVTCQGSRLFRDRPAMAILQVGNEVELPTWGASLADAFPGALYQPLDVASREVRRTLDPTTPVAYVRAGSFRQVPPLPHEDVCGVNQYTGRYGGRADEIGRDLAEFARQALLANRPLMVTEWNGPRYSWASTGVGGVSDRGCAWYLDAYYRAMLDTPGIVGSSEFTLNWVLAPFEDLTNQTREEERRQRLPHAPFGGGHTADHVPLVSPVQAVRGAPFQAMQAFQGPFHVPANRPGAVLVRHTPAARAGAERIAAALRELRKSVDVQPGTATDDLAAWRGHVLLLAAPGEPLPVLDRLLAEHRLESPTPGAPEPLIQRRVHPLHPDYTLTALSAADPEAFARGLDRLAQSAEALLDLARQEGAMSRCLALTDPELVRTYQGYVLEFAARGYHFGGDDTRTSLDPSEFHRDGRRLPAWQDLAAVILDCARPLAAAELALVDRLLAAGVNAVISLPCYRANPALHDRFPAEIGPEHSLTDSYRPDPALARPLEIHDLGGADLATIRAFQPAQADSPALRIAELAARDAAPLAATADGRPVVVLWKKGTASVTLFGCAIGAAARLHGQVTRAGKTHPLYDRDTACGLERLSRAVVNATRFGQPAVRLRPRLCLVTEPEATLVNAGQPFGLHVRLTNVEGKPVEGQLRARVRWLVDGRAGDGTAYVDLAAASPGDYRVQVTPAPGTAAPAATAPTAALPCPPLPTGGTPTSQRLISVQLKGFAEGCIPVNGGLCVVVDTRGAKGRP